MLQPLNQTAQSWVASFSAGDSIGNSLEFFPHLKMPPRDLLKSVTMICQDVIEKLSRFADHRVGIYCRWSVIIYRRVSFG